MLGKDSFRNPTADQFRHMFQPVVVAAKVGLAKLSVFGVEARLEFEVNDRTREARFRVRVTAHCQCTDQFTWDHNYPLEEFDDVVFRLTNAPQWFKEGQKMMQRCACAVGTARVVPMQKMLGVTKPAFNEYTDGGRIDYQSELDPKGLDGGSSVNQYLSRANMLMAQATKMQAESGYQLKPHDPGACPLIDCDACDEIIFGKKKVRA